MDAFYESLPFELWRNIGDHMTMVDMIAFLKIMPEHFGAIMPAGGFEVPWVKGFNKIEGDISLASILREAAIPERVMDIRFVSPKNGAISHVQQVMTSTPIHGYALSPEEVQRYDARTQAIMTHCTGEGEPDSYRLDVAWHHVDGKGQADPDPFFEASNVYVLNVLPGEQQDRYGEHTPLDDAGNRNYLLNLVSFKAYQAFSKEIEKLNDSYKAHQTAARETEKDAAQREARTKATQTDAQPSADV